MKKKLKKRYRILIGIACFVGALSISIPSYLAIKYPEVNSGLRFSGWIYKIFSFSTVDQLRMIGESGITVDKEVPKDDNMDIEEIVIKSRDGNDLSLIVYKSKDVQPDATGLLWCHGGGFALNSAKGVTNFVRNFVLKTNTVVIAPEYTLSAQSPYPAAFNDCYDALLWMKDNSEQLGIRENQIFVGGASAGGALTAALTLYARDYGDVNIAFQMPIYPMINDKMDTKSMIGNRSMKWDELENRAAWKLYLGDLYESEDVPKYAAPMREKDLSNLPPAYTYVGDLDPFLDDTIQYVENLKNAGVVASCDMYKGAFHGFDTIKSDISTEAREKLLEEYEYAIDNYYAEQKK